MAMAKRGLGAVALAATGALLLAACGGSSGGSSNGGTSGGTAAPGGTITFQQLGEEFNHVDPQRVYTGEDLALFNGTIFRTLTAYKFSADNAEGTSLTPDMATDLGTPTEEGKVWSFTLRDGITFQDGSAVGCSDVKYGVSRTFAQDIINEGPTYAIDYLDIPKDKDGNPTYKGPYDDSADNDVAAFDKAVTCSDDDLTITFNLAQSVPDFNYTVTLTAFSPVPADSDTGEKYDNMPVSSGPYQIESYKKGKGGSMVMVRNPNWNKDSDPYRPAYLDSYVVQFGIDPAIATQTTVNSSGDDAYTTAGVPTSELATVFTDPDLENRRINAFDPYTNYFAINTQTITNVKLRQALLAAMNRETIRKANGGDFAGDYADGPLKPNIGIDYAPTGLWDTLLGQAIPAAGDPDYAKQLIADSGESMPAITYDYPQSPDRDKEAAAVKEGLERAGISVTLKGLEPGTYYSYIFDPKKADELMWAGWGPDWPNASTVIPPLFVSGWNISQVDDADFTAAVKDASTDLDRQSQATKWQALNTETVQQAWIVPTLFGLQQRVAGTGIGQDVIYSWPAYGSWPYGAMWVNQG